MFTFLKKVRIQKQVIQKNWFRNYVSENRFLIRNSQNDVVCLEFICMDSMIFEYFTFPEVESM